jgi:hypothetical protein
VVKAQKELINQYLIKREKKNMKEKVVILIPKVNKKI